MPLIQSTITNENKEKIASSVPMDQTGEAYELASPV